MEVVTTLCTRTPGWLRTDNALGSLESSLLLGPRLHVRHNLRFGHHPVDQRREERVAVHNRGGDAVQIVSEPVEAGDDGNIADGELQRENKNANI